MKRQRFTPRPNWQQIAQQLGFVFHTSDGHTYWDESVAYEFSMAEIDTIEANTQILHSLCMEAVERIVYDRTLMATMGITPDYMDVIKWSWQNQKNISLYGRFDFAYCDGQLKMLEYNADTPTGLFESSVFQWYWLEDLQKALGDNDLDQFNNIHDTAVSYFSRSGIKEPMYFAATRESLEDLATVEYLREIAHQAGLTSHLIFLEDIGLDNNTGEFVDLNNQTIKHLFKLMPWEDIAVCDFGKAAAANTLNGRTVFTEPAWKSVLSNKALMAVLWQMYPEHPLLLPTWFAERAPNLDQYVVKPFFSREGSNIEIWQNNQILETTRTDLPLLKSQQIVQQKAQLFNQDGHNMILGSWIVDNLACGMLVRESTGLITGVNSTVVPHYIKD